jgi:hypothetical protein
VESQERAFHLISASPRSFCGSGRTRISWEWKLESVDRFPGARGGQTWKERLLCLVTPRLHLSDELLLGGAITSSSFTNLRIRPRSHRHRVFAVCRGCVIAIASYRGMLAFRPVVLCEMAGRILASANLLSGGFSASAITAKCHQSTDVAADIWRLSYRSSRFIIIVGHSASCGQRSL